MCVQISTILHARISTITTGVVEKKFHVYSEICISSLIFLATRSSLAWTSSFSTTHSITIHGAAHTDIVADSDRLGQVFTNLISNAVKYSPQAKHVDIFITASQNTVTVSIRDYGIGIPKEHQQKIFDRFYRVSEAHDRTFPELGMGLYISSEIVKSHGDKLWVESTDSEGATFFISLPIA